MLYLVPANAKLCLMTSDSVIQSCGAFPDKNPSQLITVSSAVCSPHLPAGQVEVAAITPPDSSDVSIKYADSTSRPVTARNGVIAVLASQSGPLPQKVAWTGPSGRHYSGTGLTRYATSGRCAG